MRQNPVFREGVGIYLLEGHGATVYVYLLMILAPIEFLTLFLPSLDPQAWMGAANLFKVSAVVAMLTMVYFALRIANREFVAWRFLSLKQWIVERGIRLSQVAIGQFSLLCLHAALLMLVSLPLLIWAAAIARASAAAILATFSLLFFYALAYGVWGLAAAILWERRLESRQVFIRCFFFALIIASALLYLPLNPVAFLIYTLGQKEIAPLMLGATQWSAATLHFLFHFILFGLGLLAYRWTLKRESLL